MLYILLPTIIIVSIMSAAVGGLVVGLLLYLDFRALKTRTRAEQAEFITLAAELYHLKLEKLNAKYDAICKDNEMRPRRDEDRVQHPGDTGPQPPGCAERPDSAGTGIPVAHGNQLIHNPRHRPPIHQTVRL